MEDVGGIKLLVQFIVSAPEEIDGKPNTEGLEVAAEVNERVARLRCGGQELVEKELMFIEVQREDFGIIERCCLFVQVCVSRSYLLEDGTWSEWDEMRV